VLTTIIINDIHLPFEDKPVVKLVTNFIKYDLDPDQIILNGDIVDCFPISQFEKSPLTRVNLQDEIEAARNLMNAFKNVPHKLWIGGNHEDRLRRYIWNQAPALGVLSELEFPQLFKLADYGFKWVPYKEYSMVGQLMVTHGEICRKHSGESARAHYEKFGLSVLHGHTHRMGVFYKTKLGRPKAAFENGCLCGMSPAWTKYPDWQQGLAVVHSDEQTGEFHVQQLPIFNRNGKPVFYYGKDRIG